METITPEMWLGLGVVLCFALGWIAGAQRWCSW